MKKFIAMICATALALSPMAVYGAEFDGDVCENPWQNIFTTHQDGTKETTTNAGGQSTNQQSTTQTQGTTNQVQKVTTKRPKKTKIKSMKKKSLKVVVTLKKVKKVGGYQVQYSTNKKFKKGKKITKKVNSKKVKLTIKKLTKKKYYVRARTYIVVNNKKVYSKWSKKKVIKK